MYPLLKPQKVQKYIDFMNKIDDEKSGNTIPIFFVKIFKIFTTLSS